MAVECFKVFLLFGVVSLIRAHESHVGKCPWIPPVPHFDITKFTGNWYSVQKTSPLAPCVTYHVAGTDADDKYILTEYSDLGNNRFQYKFSGQLSIVFPDDPGKLYLRYPRALKGYRYHVFATDYTNYAGIFICQNYGLFHRRSIVLLSRERTLADHYMLAMINKLQEFEIPLDGLTTIDQEYCLRESLHHHTVHHPAHGPPQPPPPVQPFVPLETGQPTQPVQPLQPAESVVPLETGQPIQPLETGQPIQPLETGQPMQPLETSQPFEPVQPFLETASGQPPTPVNIVTDFPLVGVEESVPTFNVNLEEVLKENSDAAIFELGSTPTESTGSSVDPRFQ